MQDSEGYRTQDRFPYDRAGWRSNDIYYIASDVWTTDINAGTDPKRAIRHIEAAGYLVRGDSDHLKAKVPGVPGRPRAVAVRASIVAAGDDRSAEEIDAEIEEDQERYTLIADNEDY